MECVSVLPVTRKMTVKRHISKENNKHIYDYYY